jgi:hypothetical protein
MINELLHLTWMFKTLELKLYDVFLYSLDMDIVPMIDVWHKIICKHLAKK